MSDIPNTVIDCQYATDFSPVLTCAPDFSHEACKGDVSFRSLLDEQSSFSDGEPIQQPAFTLLPPELPIEIERADLAMTHQMTQASQGSGSYARELSDWEKYKDDQLLSNPGGDHYDYRKNAIVPQAKSPEPFWERIGKDISDSFDNLKNCLDNLLLGAKTLYRDENDQIQEATQKGLLGSMGDFFKDMGSALSFGAWRPDGEAPPDGFGNRMKFFFSKMKEALFGDIVQGVGGSALRSGESLVLAGWNILEVVPDATIGNFEKGAKLTTTIFDNGQVAIDYLTDIIPTGEAWIRVHSPNFEDLNDAKAPVIYNIQLPERYGEDARWKYIRNTPFRKTVETIGSLLADVATLKVLGDTSFSSEGRKD
jgi:hypothetical protein